MKLKNFGGLLLISTIMAGCSLGGFRAPVFDVAEAQKREAVASGTKIQREKDWRPRTYVVRRGDTLYSIAFNYGFDYRELADLNGIKNPGVISVGQVIHLFPGKTPSATHASTANSLIKEQPKLVKFPYSAGAMAQIEKIQEPGSTASTAVANAENADTDGTVDESEEPALKWILPTQGKLIGSFSESANRKGIDIAGNLGQPVVAVESGKVVYSGSGLRGYGKLIIIKHNKTYLSAYAHNDKLLVKEGQNVTRGQSIAAMGKTDTNQVKLHFEVRRYGKPVNPANYLPLGKS